MKAIFVVEGGRLVPAEPEAVEELTRVKDGTKFICDSCSPREAIWFRRWWKLCAIVAENMPAFHADARGVSDMILIACGRVHWRINPTTGEMTPVPKSIAIENMREDDARRLWEVAVWYVHHNWLPIGTARLEAEIADFFAGPELRSLGKRVVPEKETA